MPPDQLCIATLLFRFTTKQLASNPSSFTPVFFIINFPISLNSQILKTRDVRFKASCLHRLCSWCSCTWCCSWHNRSVVSVVCVSPSLLSINLFFPYLACHPSFASLVLGFPTSSATLRGGFLWKLTPPAVGGSPLELSFNGRATL